MIRHVIFPERRLVSVLPLGEIHYDELFAWHMTLAQDPDYRHDYDAIVSHLNSELKLSPEELKLLIGHNAESKLVTGKWAHLVDTPLATAMSLLYESNKEVQHPMRTFSTAEGVSSYLGYDITPYLLDP